MSDLVRNALFQIQVRAVGVRIGLAVGLHGGVLLLEVGGPPPRRWQISVSRMD
jgi:hypothetical protein